MRYEYDEKQECFIREDGLGKKFFINSTEAHRIINMYNLDRNLLVNEENIEDILNKLDRKYYFDELKEGRLGHRIKREMEINGNIELEDNNGKNSSLGLIARKGSMSIKECEKFENKLFYRNGKFIEVRNDGNENDSLYISNKKVATFDGYFYFIF